MFSVMPLVATMTCALFSMVAVDRTHDWPESWPGVFNFYTDQAQTARVATGYQANWYQISFDTPEDFERLWPALLSLLDEGSQITIRAVGDLHSHHLGSDWDSRRPVVRIFAPPYDSIAGFPPWIDKEGRHISSARMKLNLKVLNHQPLTVDEQALVDAEPVESYDMRLDVEAMKENNGMWLRPGAPWPEDLRDEAGALPEKVHSQEVDGRLRWVAGPGEHFSIRCRIDLELVADGYIIDATELEFPPNVKVIDERPTPWLQRR